MTADRVRIAILSVIGLVAGGCQPQPAVVPKNHSNGSPSSTDSGRHSSEPINPALFLSLTLDDFTPFQGEKGTWRSEDGMIVCSGSPKGYLYSNKSYDNFILQGEYQFLLSEDQLPKADKANTGFMLLIQEPHKVWPISLEVQGRFDTMASINANGGLAALEITDHPEVRERVRRPVGEWNEVKIKCRDGAISAFLNGYLVCTSAATDLKSGKIGLQAEGFTVRFRNLSIYEESK